MLYRLDLFINPFRLNTGVNDNPILKLICNGKTNGKTIANNKH